MIDFKNLKQGIEKNGTIVDPQLISLWDDSLNRRHTIEGEITQAATSEIIYGIYKANKEDENVPIEERVPIKIYINSCGGELHPAMGLIDIILISKTPVYTICEGVAYSAAGLILMSGHVRYCYPSNSFLLHSGSNGALNTTDKVFDQLEFDKKYEEKVKNRVLTLTKITESEYIEKYRNDWYMMSEDMIKYGIVDKILDTIVF